MDRKSYNLYQLGNEKEARLWKEAIFVFDSSALLDLYSYPELTRNKFFKDVIEKLKGRVWIPAHVEFEFLKNRTSVIKKTISENYGSLKDEYLKSISESFSKTKNLLQQLEVNTTNSRKHPYIEGIDFKEIKEELDKVQETYKKFEGQFKAKIVEREKEILDLETNDTVLDRIEKLFPVGDKYTTDEILEIVEDGKLRYEFKIPPGFEDSGKEGTQIFGDLIIWNQILDFGENNKVPIVFICNDVKPDWWNIIDKKKKSKSVKEELIKEFNDRTAFEFWMYDQLEFMHNANTYLKSAIPDDELEVISSLFGDFRNDTAVLTFRCGRCKKTDHIGRADLDLDFDLSGSTERQMGEEKEYKADSYFKCNYCQEDIHGIFSVFEYPDGIKNYQSIELEGADVIRECLINVPFLENKDDIEIDGIEQILFDYISDESPDNLMMLSSETVIDEVSDVDMTSISLEKDGLISVKGTGNVSVELNYGPSSDGASSSDYFPFDFECTLRKSDDGYELEEMVSLDIDNSSFYE